MLDLKCKLQTLKSLLVGNRKKNSAPEAAGILPVDCGNFKLNLSGWLLIVAFVTHCRVLEFRCCQSTSNSIHCYRLDHQIQTAPIPPH